MAPTKSMVEWKLLRLVCIFLQCARLVQCSCPPPCVCENTRILCVCTEPEERLILHTFKKRMEFATILYISDCANVTIKTDAFESMKITQEIQIRNVRSLRIEPFAFRDMDVYPQYLIVHNCVLHELLPDAFAGLSKTENFWFRHNVTVHRIHAGAFRYMVDIANVYFTESSLGRVDSEAFANMSAVTNFFFRGNVHIRSMGKEIFRFSTLKHVAFHDVRIESMSAYAFYGPQRFDTLIFDKVSFQKIDTAEIVDENSEAIPAAAPGQFQRSGRKMEFNSCEFPDTLPLGVLCSNVSYVKFRNTSVSKMDAKSGRLYNVSEMIFVRSRIEIVDSETFGSALRVDVLQFEQCEIGDILERAFENANVNRMRFSETRLQRVAEHAFYDAHVGNFAFEQCVLHELEAYAFTSLTAGRFLMQKCKIENLHRTAFQNFRSENFELEKNRFSSGADFTFRKSKANSMTIVNNEFRSEMRIDWLEGAIFRKLIFDSNKMLCACNEAMEDMTALLMWSERAKEKRSAAQPFDLGDENLCAQENDEDISLQDFWANCDKAKNGKVERRDLIANRLRCAKMFFFVQCTCVYSAEESDENSGGKTTPIFIFDKSVSKTLGTLYRNSTSLQISNCRSVHFWRHALSHIALNHLLLEECTVLELEGEFWPHNRLAPAPLLLSISRVSDVRMGDYALLFPENHKAIQKIDIHLEYCHIEKLVTHLLADSQVRNLSFYECNVGTFAPSFASGADVDFLWFEEGEIGKFEKHAFDEQTAVHQLTVKNTLIQGMHKDFASMETVRKAFVCLESNRLQCKCDVEGALKLLDANGCNGASNICYDVAGDDTPVSVIIKNSSWQSYYRACYYKSRPGSGEVRTAHQRIENALEVKSVAGKSSKSFAKNVLFAVFLALL